MGGLLTALEGESIGFVDSWQEADWATTSDTTPAGHTSQAPPKQSINEEPNYQIYESTGAISIPTTTSLS